MNFRVLLLACLHIMYLSSSSSSSFRLSLWCLSRKKSKLSSAIALLSATWSPYIAVGYILFLSFIWPNYVFREIREEMPDTEGDDNMGSAIKPSSPSQKWNNLSALVIKHGGRKVTASVRFHSSPATPPNCCCFMPACCQNTANSNSSADAPPT